MKLSWISALSLALVLSAAACNSDKKTAQDANTNTENLAAVAYDQTVDLSKEFGQNIKVKAPQGFKSTFSEGILSEAVVEGSRYYVQIIAQDLFSQNIQSLKTEALEEVKAMPEFSSIVQEDDNGFIYETTWSNAKAYNFRYFHVAGPYAYDFRSSTVYDFTKDEIINIYKAVKQ